MRMSKNKINQDPQMGQKNKQNVKTKNMDSIATDIQHITPKNERQREFLDSILQNQITFADGPAGTGKSFISILAALKVIADKRNLTQNIVLVKPNVGVDEEFGFLPGELGKKMEPLLVSLRYVLGKIIDKNCLEYLLKENYIQVQPLQFIRGMTIDNSVLILDEAQNTTVHQMKTLLTRIGENTKYIISGDSKQKDRRTGGNGLHTAMNLLQGVKDINSVHFTDADIVRNDIIKDILKRFEIEEEKQEKNKPF